MNYSSKKNVSHSRIPKIGILLANLGTPDAPTKSALKRYLGEFLSDTRVIEIPKWKWWPILNGIILQTRPKKSAALYQEIWQEDGSPLLSLAKEQEAELKKLFEKEFKGAVEIEIGMTYGNPSMKSALSRLRERSVEKLLVLPLYPQYSATSTAPALDAVFKEFLTYRVIPELRTINSYHDDPLYIDALAESIKEAWSKREPAEKLIFSYHGIPKRYFENGDHYFCHCHKTTRLVAEKLSLSKDQYMVCFQSVFGKEAWIKPATDKTIEGLAKSGVKSLDVVCPGFSCDCLETIEEIDGENREIFEENGGKDFHYIPCLNARPSIIKALFEITKRNISDWLDAVKDKTDAELKKEAEKTEALYQKRKEQAY